jgi:hypothetical protein
MDLIAATGVRTLPIAAGFLIGIGAFAAWISWMVKSTPPARTVGRLPAPLPLPTPLPLSPARRALVSPPVVAAVASAPEPTIDLREDDRAHVVRAGAFCPVQGAFGVTATGADVECTSIAGARPRWLKRRPVLAESA